MRVSWPANPTLLSQPDGMASNIHEKIIKKWMKQVLNPCCNLQMESQKRQQSPGTRPCCLPSSHVPNLPVPFTDAAVTLLNLPFTINRQASSPFQAAPLHYCIFQRRFFCSLERPKHSDALLNDGPAGGAFLHLLALMSFIARRANHLMGTR